MKVRDDELDELDLLEQTSPIAITGGVENVHGKVNALIQIYISRENLSSFSLISDLSYINQNASRICRAIFEVVLSKGWAIMTSRILDFCKMIEKRCWVSEHPLKQFDFLSPDILRKIQAKHVSIETVREMDAKDVGLFIHHVSMGSKVKKLCFNFPMLEVEATVSPISRSILRINVSIDANFNWSDGIHGSNSQSWWLWIEDPDTDYIYHSEYFLLKKKDVVCQRTQFLCLTIPIFEPLPAQYYLKFVSDRWLNCQTVLPLSFKHLILPEHHTPQTELLNLNPLPISALKNDLYEQLYPFSYFNPIQTQVFHVVRHSDCNVLLGAPTGSGKTIVAEIALYRLWEEYPGCKAVYIAPLKALVRERVRDWKEKFEFNVGRKVVELTGDHSPDVASIKRADVIITTPEKWDGISRSWKTRDYVKSVTLIIIDEIHLLGSDRGAVLEVIVSRTNYISSHTNMKVRIVGLSTALANANDLASWLGILNKGMYNFRPSVRPVPLQVHISGFPEKQYCPRMATMNKPAFQAINSYSPDKPVLVFVSSRRQTRLTALDFIAYISMKANPKKWLKMPENEIESLSQKVKDPTLAHLLLFGIGIHHAGLQEFDRKVCEELFLNQKIQVLIATSTLAWGLNFPTHLVIVKGTEYHDGKVHRYVDMPVTDVLQMIGRAGRPQYDDSGVAVVLVQDIKKPFYKKFLYDPFPLESNLLKVLPDHINAEIVAGTVQSKQNAIEFLTWTYFFRRILINPTYYELENPSEASLNTFLSQLIDQTVSELIESKCLQPIEEDETALESTVFGIISSFYYLSHKTCRILSESIISLLSFEGVLSVLCSACEYDEVPIRHNEELLNSELATRVRFTVDPSSYDNPHTKANLLLQARFDHIPLPCSDYSTDTQSVLDQSIRIVQAMLDFGAEKAYLLSTLQCVFLLQSLIQARWPDDHSLLIFAPYLSESVINQALDTHKNGDQSYTCFQSLPQFIFACSSNRPCLSKLLSSLSLTPNKISSVLSVALSLPQVSIKITLLSNAKTSFKYIIPTNSLSYKDPCWIPLNCDTEYKLLLELKCQSSIKSSKNAKKAYSPLFHKDKSESWILILGDCELQELIALKRVSQISSEGVKTHLLFNSCERPRRCIYTLYLLSDCYIGLDQEYQIFLDVNS